MLTYEYKIQAGLFCIKYMENKKEKKKLFSGNVCL
jgi:hypothetical protein